MGMKCSGLPTNYTVTIDGVEVPCLDVSVVPPFEDVPPDDRVFSRSETITVEYAVEVHRDIEVNHDTGERSDRLRLEAIDPA